MRNKSKKHRIKEVTKNQLNQQLSRLRLFYITLIIFTLIISALLALFEFGFYSILIPLFFVWISMSVYFYFITGRSAKMRLFKIFIYSITYISSLIMLFWIVGFVILGYPQGNLSITQYFISMLSYFSDILYSQHFVFRFLILVLGTLMITYKSMWIFRWVYRIPNPYTFMSIDLKGEIRKYIRYYLLIILIFGILFYSIYHLDPNSFYPSDGSLKFYDFFYFSVVTITTLGYGDIHPESLTGKILVSMEVLISILILLVYLNYMISKIKNEFTLPEMIICPKIFHKLYAYMPPDLVNKICNFVITYLFIILVFGTIFHISFVFNYDSFNVNENEKLNYLDFVYFSIVNITTLGYGDIHPESLTGKMLVSMEVLISILILLVYLPYVMSIHSQKNEIEFKRGAV